MLYSAVMAPAIFLFEVESRAFMPADYTSILFSQGKGIAAAGVDVHGLETI